MITPLNKYILLEPITEEEKTKSGLVVAETTGERTESIAIKGRVIDGSDLSGIVKKGDEVLIAKWEVHKAYVQGKEYLLIKAKHILGIIK